jgi:hypothetical protein
MTLSIKAYFASLSINKRSKTKICHYAVCRYAECRDLFIVMLNFVMLSVIMLSVMTPGKSLSE